MRTIGVLFMLTGLVLSCIEVNYALRSATERQSYQEKYSNHQDEVIRYYELKATNPYVRYPAYPRESKWSKDDLFLSSLAGFGAWLFLSGSALFLAGAVRSHHLELCKILGQMTAHQMPKEKVVSQNPTSVQRPVTDVSAATALDEMAQTTQPPKQENCIHESQSNSRVQPASVRGRNEVSIATPSPADDRAQRQLVRTAHVRPKASDSSAPTAEGVKALAYSSGAARLADELKADLDRLSKIGVNLDKVAAVSRPAGVAAGIYTGFRIHPLLGAAIAGGGLLEHFTLECIRTI